MILCAKLRHASTLNTNRSAGRLVDCSRVCSPPPLFATIVPSSLFYVWAVYTCWINYRDFAAFVERAKPSWLSVKVANFCTQSCTYKFVHSCLKAFHLVSPEVISYLWVIVYLSHFMQPHLHYLFSNKRNPIVYPDPILRSWQMSALARRSRKRRVLFHRLFGEECSVARCWFPLLTIFTDSC